MREGFCKYSIIFGTNSCIIKVPCCCIFQRFGFDYYFLNLYTLIEGTWQISAIGGPGSGAGYLKRSGMGFFFVPFKEQTLKSLIHLPAIFSGHDTYFSSLSSDNALSVQNLILSARAL